jgi:hypothetical protein
MNMRGRQRGNIDHLIGAKFNKLTIIRDLPYTKKDGRLVLCLCDCGKEYIGRLRGIRSGHMQSCGCLRSKFVVGRSLHGLHEHPLYQVWVNVIQRCENENAPNYIGYGAKGVKICSEWRSDFMVFYKWAIDNGYKRGGRLRLDKDIKSDVKPGKLYSPETCCFVTAKVNSRNRGNNRILTHNGESLCVSEWAEKLEMSSVTIHGRLKSGWAVERILTQPVKKYNYE